MTEEERFRPIPLGPHGFYGKEDETIEQIVNWMLKRPFKKTID